MFAINFYVRYVTSHMWHLILHSVLFYFCNFYQLSSFSIRHLNGKTVGVDPRFISFEQAEEWKSKWKTMVILKEAPGQSKVNVHQPPYVLIPKDPDMS